MSTLLVLPKYGVVLELMQQIGVLGSFFLNVNVCRYHIQDGSHLSLAPLSV